MNFKAFSAALALLAIGSASANAATDNNIRIFDSVTFYDGYLLENNPDKDLDDGILRHSTSLYAVKLTDEQLEKIGTQLNVNVWVEACCDNYDRIGNINLALVPKGEATYDRNEVQRIELGRFITPFMNKNYEPKVVPYAYAMNYLCPILRDKSLRETYDIWAEFELFGIPYAANEQVAGCAGRNDVFKGTLEFATDEPAELTDDNVLVPIVMKKPEYIGGNLNNYNENATDELGKTIKTYTFTVPKDVAASRLVLITSNHGANSGGEEYNRRWHYIYYDGELTHSYVPGGVSCEDYRIYNTQPNGIYGYVKQNLFYWRSFSNWCPGAVIDNRIIELGAMTAGEHKVTISVPDAAFNGGQGDIPVSMFFQGSVTGETFSGLDMAVVNDNPAHVTVADGAVTVDGGVYEVLGLEIYDTAGQLRARQQGAAALSVASLHAGVYLLNIELDNGIIETHKIRL